MGFPRYVLSYWFPELRATINDPTATLADWFNDSGGISSTGLRVNTNTAITLSAVWRAVSIYSSLIASLPIQLFRKTDDKTEQIKEHPGLDLMAVKPNEVMTAFTFKETLQTYPLTWGNGYAYIWMSNGNPKELQLLKPNDVAVKSTNGRDIFYDVTGFRNNIPARNMLHMKGMSFDGFVGKSPIGVASESMGGGLALQQFANKFFANGANSSGVLIHPGVLKPEGKKNIRDSFRRDNQGLKNASDVMILEEGMKFIPLTIPPETAQFLQSRKFSVLEIARWYGLPPHLLMDNDKATYNNTELQGIEFLTYSLRSWLKRWESELDLKLLTTEQQKNHFFKFNINALLRADSKSRAIFYRIMLDMGVFNINKVLSLENMNGIGPDGDKHLVQLARTDIKNIGSNGDVNNKQLSKEIVDLIFKEKSHGQIL